MTRLTSVVVLGAGMVGICTALQLAQRGHAVTLVDRREPGVSAEAMEAARQAYEAAGVSAGDIDVAEIHDCFSMAEVVHSEDLGLVPRGMGAKWAAEGRTAVGGDIAINANADARIARAGSGHSSPLRASISRSRRTHASRAHLQWSVP